MKCDFVQSGAQQVTCRNCGRKIITGHPPARVHAPCKLGEAEAGSGAGGTPVAAIPPRPRCIHRGEELRRELCESCLAKVELKIFGCTEFGECVLGKAPRAGLASCATCPKFEPAPQPTPQRRTVHPFGPQMVSGDEDPGPVFATPGIELPPVQFWQSTRNLICHIYPLTAGQKWRRIIAHLGARPQLFNGRRIFVVSRDHECDSFDEVGAAIVDAAGVPPSGGGSLEIFEVPNNAELGEAATFPLLLDRLAARVAGVTAGVPPSGGGASSDPSRLKAELQQEITFYCHTKGCTWPDSGALAHEWGDVMAASCLDYPELVGKALSTAAFVGSFRRFCEPKDRLAPWHFSGTFWWFRNDYLFAQKSWRHVVTDWVGVEGYPPTQCPLGHSACLFLDHAHDLYRADYWDAVVRPAWRRWREARRVELAQTP